MLGIWVLIFCAGVSGCLSAFPDLGWHFWAVLAVGSLCAALVAMTAVWGA